MVQNGGRRIRLCCPEHNVQGFSTKKKFQNVKSPQPIFANIKWLD
jgi:hypothetical protein